jgi:hypothetical protein
VYRYTFVHIYLYLMHSKCFEAWGESHLSNTLMISCFSFFIVYLLAGLGLNSGPLLSKCSTTWTLPQPFLLSLVIFLVYLVIFQIRSCTFCQGQTQTPIFPPTLVHRWDYRWPTVRTFFEIRSSSLFFGTGWSWAMILWLLPPK